MATPALVQQVDYQCAVNGVLIERNAESFGESGGLMTALELQRVEEAQRAGVPPAVCAERILQTRATRGPATLTGPTLRQAIEAIRKADACPTCHLPRGLANANAAIGLKGYRPERAQLGVHCACAGGPAEQLRIELRAFVAATFEGAIGEGQLPFPTLEAALEEIEAAVAAKARRPLTPAELGNLRGAIRIEWSRRPMEQLSTERLHEICADDTKSIGESFEAMTELKRRGIAL